MLRRYRRYFAIVAFMLLAAPLIVGIVRPDDPDLILKEGRRLTPAPIAPATFEDWLSLPKEVDAYLKDRFGLREKMIRLHKDLTKPIIPEGNPIVLIGRNGHMFLKLENMLQQSAGLLLRDKSVSDTADTLASMRDALARRGIKFLVAVPPNASTIYPDDLPVWARSGGRKTEYDLLLEDLASARRQDDRLAALDDSGPIPGTGLLPARHALDPARRARCVQRDRRSRHAPRLAT